MEATTRWLFVLDLAGALLEVSTTGRRHPIPEAVADTLVARGWAARHHGRGPSVWLTITGSGMTAARHVPLP